MIGEVGAYQENTQMVLRTWTKLQRKERAEAERKLQLARQAQASPGDPRRELNQQNRWLASLNAETSAGCWACGSHCIIGLAKPSGARHQATPQRRPHLVGPEMVQTVSAGGR
jgi:hypothetical protein